MAMKTATDVRLNDIIVERNERGRVVRKARVVEIRPCSKGTKVHLNNWCYETFQTVETL